MEEQELAVKEIMVEQEIVLLLIMELAEVVEQTQLVEMEHRLQVEMVELA